MTTPRRAGCVAVLAAAGVLAAGPAGADEIVRVDFGTSASPVRKGFLRVTDKTRWAEDSPAGWLDAKRLRSRSWPLPREWTFNESRGRKYPPPIYTTDLRQDHVGGRGPATLRICLADGAWRLWLLCGTGGGSRYQVWNVRAATAGEADEATFSGPYAPRVLRLGGRAKGGRLDLTVSTKSRWALGALLAVPERQWPAAAAGEIARIERETFLLPDDVLARWKHTPHEEQASPPAPTAEEKRRGFLVYHRPYLEPIWPNTAPQRIECDPTLRAFASRGEYEPLTFTILPLRDLPAVTVRAGELRTTNGHAIPPENVDVRYVRYLHVRPNYSTFFTYYRAPDVLMPFRRPQTLASGENLRVWITLRTGPFAPAGVYKGGVWIEMGGKPAAEVPVVFRVLPIRLQKDDSLVYGTYYRHPYDMARYAPDGFSRRWWVRKAEREFADMAAHGLNAFVSGIGGRMNQAGRWSMDFDALGAKIDLARRHGFDKPIICHIPTSVAWRKHVGGAMGSHLRLVKDLPPKGFFDDMTAMVRAIEAGRKRRRWPELLYYPIDEPGRSAAAVRLMVEVLKALKRVPNVRTYVTADPAHEAFAPMKPYVDVWCCQPFSPPFKDVPGAAYWCYPNHVAGENDHTPVAGARMTYGFGFWRSGYEALTPWIYQAVTGDPWNYLDGGYMDFFNRTGDDAGPIPVTLWEAYREGIDDGRYVTTLERAIDRARDAGLASAADEASKELDFVRDAIDVREKYKYDGLWAPETFDVYRWIVARQILKLQEARERLARGK